MEDIGEQFGSTIEDAVDTLTKREDEEYMEFIDRAATNPIVRRVKLADVEDNMDLMWLAEVDDDIMNKQQTYHEVWHRLQDQCPDPEDSFNSRRRVD